jgi:hypothetical protein
VSVRADSGLACADPVGYQVLSPRQRLTATPWAVQARNAQRLGGLLSSDYAAASHGHDASALISGIVSDARLPVNLARTNVVQTYSAVPAFNGGTSGATPPFTVDSAQLVTNLNADLLDGLNSTAFSLASHTHDASAVTTGTLLDARLSINIPRLSANNVFAGTNTFQGIVNIESASSVIRGDGSGLTALNATQIVTGQVADSRLPSTLARLANANTFTNGQTITTTGQFAMTVNSSSSGGAWMLLRNTAAGGREYNLISTANGNSEGAGKLLVRDGSSAAVRMAFDSDGDVGIGTTTPGSKLTVAGLIESTSGGVKFPDGTIQTTMANGIPGPQGPQGPQGPVGPTGPQGPSGTGDGGMAVDNLQGAVYTNRPLVVANLSSTPSRGGVTVPSPYGTNSFVATDGSSTVRASMGTSGSDGYLQIMKGDGARAVELFNSGSNRGTVICDSVFGNVLVQTNTLFAAVKLFRVNHPADSSKTVNYACLEGPEAAMYSRGTARLQSGIAVIELPEHFALMASEQGMTVQLTPRSVDSLGLAAVEVSPSQVVVRELGRGTNSYDFDYMITAVRKGFEDFKVIMPQGELPSFKVPSTQYPADAISGPAQLDAARGR